jgi:hypothetical protein
MKKSSTKKTAKTTKANKPKAKAAAPAKADKPMSGLDAAAKVLSASKEPLSAKQIVETMLAKGMWKTSGATPWATIYAAMIREIAAKGGEARFKKTDRGRFTAA